MCRSEFLALTMPISLQNTELIYSELYTLGNINLHTAQESIMTSDSSYQRSVDFFHVVGFGNTAD